MAARSLVATITGTVIGIATLAGCGAGDEASTPRVPVTCASNDPTAEEPTAPGMLLCVGTTGHVPLTDDRDRQHLVEVAVQAVELVPRSVVDRLSAEELDIDTDPREVDIYAVHARARLGDPADVDPLRDLLLYSRENDFADPHVLSGWAPAGCRHREFTTSMPAGATLRTCDWRAVPRGADLTGVTLGSEIDDYAVYGGNPVSWSLRED